MKKIKVDSGGSIFVAHKYRFGGENRKVSIT